MTIKLIQYKVGIIGCGGISRMHAGWYKNYSRTEITCASDINENNLKKFSDEFGIEKSYTDYIEMLEKENLTLLVYAHGLHHIKLMIDEGLC